MIVLKVLDLLLVFLGFLTMQNLELVELLFEGRFLCHLLQQFLSHGFEVLLQEFVAIVLNEGGTVVVAHQELVAVV